MSDAETLQPLLGIVTVIIVFGGLPMTVAGIFISTIWVIDRSDPALFCTSRPLGNFAAFTSAVTAGVGTWLLWMRWNGPAYVDPWQVIGGLITGISAVVILGFLTRWRRSGPFLVGLGALLGFSTAFAVEAGFYDDTGLWGVGYLMLITGAGCGLFLVSLCVGLLRNPPPQASYTTAEQKIPLSDHD